MSPSVSRLLIACCLSLACARGASAQRIWVVDPQGRPGTDFTTLLPAVAAAQHGDTIRVRGGEHPAQTIDKAIAILGEPGSNATIAFGPLATLLIENIPVGRQCVIKGFVSRRTSLFPGTVQVQNCPGRVLLERITNGDPYPMSIVITAASHVVLNGVTSNGGNPPFRIAATDSQFVLVDSALEGLSGPQSFPGMPALMATNCFVHVSRSRITGGSSGIARSGEGIQLTDSELVLAGDNTSLVAAGSSSVPVSAITTFRGSVVHDPRVPLAPAAGAPAIWGNGAVSATWLPSLRGLGAPPGGIVTTEAVSPAGDVLVFLAGLPASRLPVPGLGDLWLDPSLVIVGGVALQGPSEHTSWPLTVPNDPALVFVAFAQQVLSGTVSGGFKLSNPAIYCHD